MDRRRAFAIRAFPYVLVVLAASAGAFAQTTVYVDDNNCPGPGSGTSVDPYCRIQDAICDLNGSGGGTVMVRPGRYNESLRMFGGVSVVSTDGADVTIIDGSGKPCITSGCQVNQNTTSCSTVVYGSGSGVNDRLEGFTIRGGAGLFRSLSTDDFVAGGGIFVYNSSPTITRNRIVENVMSSTQTDDFIGAGIYIEGGGAGSPNDPVITYNLIRDNVADPPAGSGGGVLQAYAIGGGIYVGQFAGGHIEDNVIEYNRVGTVGTSNQFGIGGAIAVYSYNVEPVISRNIIRRNHSSDNAAAISMGVIYAPPKYESTMALIDNNLVDSNSAVSDGGGFHARTSLATVRSNTFTDNVIGSYGGGLFLGPNANRNDDVVLVNNNVAFNVTDVDYGQGGGVFIDQAANYLLTYHNLHGNLPDNVGGFRTESQIVGSDGNVNADPVFANRAERYRNLRLTSGTSILDGGDNAVAAAEDLDRTARVVDGDATNGTVIDLGAYEYDPAAGPDLDGDGDPDVSDTDDDGDGVDDTIDCDALDNAVSSVPGPVGPRLSVSNDAAGGDVLTVRWPVVAEGRVYNVYRGSFGSGPFTPNETCWLGETPISETTDTAVPLVGEGFYYLVSAKNGCGESRMGQDNVGGVRSDVFPAGACPDQFLDDDADGVPTVADNCPLVANGSQADLDLDLFGDACDCALYDSANPVPSEVPRLAIELLTSTRLTWDDVGTGRYDVLGGSISSLRTAGVGNADCLADDEPNPQFDDTRPDPVSGEGYYYLVRAENDCGAGPLGQATTGAQRSALGGCP